MKRGDPRIITVGDAKLEAQYLGKGQFTTAYQVGKDVYAFTVDDWAKEAMCDLRGEHCPKIQKVDTQEDPRTGDDVYVYKMPLYEKLTAAHKEAWKDAKHLRQTMEQVRTDRWRKGARGGKVPNLVHEGYAMMCDLIDRVEVKEPLKESLEEIRDAGANYSDSICFEFPTRNLAVEEGKLILLDVIFDEEEMARRNKIAQEKAQARRDNLGYGWGGFGGGRGR